MNPLSVAKGRIERELRPPAGEEVNFWLEAQQLKSAVAAMAARGDELGVRSAAAAFGGLVKRWRRFLIELLTEAVWRGKDVSRGAMRQWQARVFGQAVASGRLSQYAKPERSGGGRARIELPDAALEQAAARLYQASRDRIKRL